MPEKVSLTWVETDAGQIWRSTCGRYVIMAITLPENPPKVEYLARRIDPAMAAAYPERNTLGFLLESSPWCWNEENNVHSAQAICERDAYTLANARPFPEDYPAIAMERFGQGLREALVIVWDSGELVARHMHMGLRTHEEGFVPQQSSTEINLTALGLVPGEGVELTTTTERDTDRCNGCRVRVGEYHRDRCSVARCLVTGRQRLMCAYFGDSPVAGIHAVTTGGSQQEFEDYFKTPTGHDCGQDIYTGKDD